MKYFVGVLEYRRQYLVIEAENEKEALDKVEKGEGNYLGESDFEKNSSEN